MHRLARIAANPLKNWKYERWATNCKTPLLNSSGKVSHILICSYKQKQKKRPIFILEVAIVVNSK